MSRPIALLLSVSLAALGFAVAAHADGSSYRGSDDESSLLVTKGTVIRDVTVVDTRNGSLAHRQSVVIDGAKIQQITGRRVRVSGTAQTVDGHGKYVVPGFN